MGKYFSPTSDPGRFEARSRRAGKCFFHVQASAICVVKPYKAGSRKNRIPVSPGKSRGNFLYLNRPLEESESSHVCKRFVEFSNVKNTDGILNRTFRV